MASIEQLEKEEMQQLKTILEEGLANFHRYQ
jgi:hypothetical protein